MAEIDYSSLDAFLAGQDGADAAAVYLLFGESYFYQQGVRRILAHLSAGGSGPVADYEAVEGEDENIPKVIDRLTTYAMFGGGKVIGFTDAKLFFARQDRGTLIEKSRSAYEEGDLKQAGRYMGTVLGLAGMSLDSVAASVPDAARQVCPDPGGSIGWIEEVLAYCVEKKMPVTRSESAVGQLEAAIEKGFPGGNRLIITTETVDRRRTLYKLIRRKGLVVNCSVARGERLADRQQQQKVLMEEARTLLRQHGKKMDTAAFRAMVDLTGFDLPVFRDSLEKLIHYTRGEETITAGDVRSMLRRTRSDPVYELTNAVADRNAGRALFFLQSLLRNRYHPLQILAALVNQVRKLLVVRSFMEGPGRGCWHAGLTYQRFQQQVLPEFMAHEKSVSGVFRQWEDLPPASGGKGDGSAGKGGKRKKGSLPDVLVVKNPKNAYPVFQLFVKAGNFTLPELIRAVLDLNRLDVQMKSTGRPPGQVLEEAVFRICGVVGGSKGDR